MALWSTDVLRPPKFNAGPSSIGSPKREQNLLPAYEIIAHANKKRQVLALVENKQQRYLYIQYILVTY